LKSGTVWIITPSGDAKFYREHGIAHLGGVEDASHGSERGATATEACLAAKFVSGPSAELSAW
jgi:hypothetical protein